MNHAKLALIVSKKTLQPEYIIPGFGKFPPSAKPAARLPMPFPGQFLLALFRIPEFPEKPIPKPFTEPWRERWLSISATVSDHSKNKCVEFFGGSGLSTLMDLANKGCDPNLVMSLFARYLWDKTVPPQEQFDPDVKSHLSDLKAVQATRRLFRNHTWKKTAETELVARALDGLEAIVQSYVNESDFSTGRGRQNDKENRVIYAIHEHLLKQEAGKQWRLTLELFVAAGAVLIESTKRHQNPANESAQRRIKPRLKSFERDHPKEARMITDFVWKWPATYPHLLSK